MAKHLTMCPECGAANRADSEWCGQCYTSLLAPSEDPAVPDSPPATVVDAVTTTSTSGADPDADDATAPAGPGWECRFCGAADNPVDASNCRLCYRSIFDSYGGEHVPRLDPEKALRHSAFFPGLGLMRLGWSAHGIAIAAVVLFALSSALFLIPTGEVVAGLMLLLLAAGVWAVAARDAAVVAAGRPGTIWLTPQVLLVTAVMVFVISGLAFAQALGEARSEL